MPRDFDEEDYSWTRWRKSRVFVHNKAASERKRSVRTPVPANVSYEKIQIWRQSCSETHGDCCNNRHSEALAQQLDSLNLIDVQSYSLVTLPTSTPFVALSYVWGNVLMPKAQMANLNALKKPGALSENKDNIRIPDTIRDAIYLVGQLGERYLWVDCFCVVQDAGPEEMDKMLRAMACIYASAEFTIAAAGGPDANHGLRGIGGPSQNRPLPDVGRRTPLLRDGFPWSSTWASRGWTFQESLFSRRLLIFEGVVSWVCGRCMWLEEQDHAANDSNAQKSSKVWPTERAHLGVPMGMMSIKPELPTLGRWGMLVENFSTRALSYDEDVYRAFAGATEIMSSTFPGGVSHGIPDFFFDIALLWQPQYHVLRRSEGPSWSWTGWKGGVTCLNYWYPHYAGVYRSTGESSDWITIAPLKPVASFRKQISIEAKYVENKSLNGFYEYQAIRNDTKTLLPPGWTRVTHPSGDYFTNSTIKDGSFNYAYPLPTACPHPPQSALLPSPILLCTAPRATLHLGEQKYSNRDNPIVLLTLCSITVGILTLYDDIMSEASPGTSCDLIAISEAQIADPERVDECFLWQAGFSQGGSPYICWNDYIDNKAQSGVEDFYNVLWIGWKGDVAHRKALGKVGKSAWDALGAEVVDIKLG